MKRFLSFLLVLVMVVSLIPARFFSITVNAATNSFAGGSGTADDPYLIETKEHLNNVRNDLGAHYKLIADIIFTDADFAIGGKYYNSGNAWIPIGASTAAPFTGIFDGNGKSIKALRVKATTSEIIYAGLFGCCSGGRISNLTMEGGSIEVNGSTKVYAGGICAYSSNTYFIGCNNTNNLVVIVHAESTGVEPYSYVGGISGYGGNCENCENSGNITTEVKVYNDDYDFAYCGGIVGGYSGAISNCANYGSISATSMSTWTAACLDVGGIVGSSSKTISCCKNFGDVSCSANNMTSAYAGGICGSFSGSLLEQSYNSGIVEGPHAGGIAGSLRHGTISNCYNLSEIISSDYIGGIVGYITYNGEVNNCYNVGMLNGSDNSVRIGGITGYMSSGISVNCYFIDTATSGTGRGSATTVKLSADEMRQNVSYVGYDFVNVWEFKEKNHYLYPTLINNPYYDGDFAGGSGTETDPYIIQNKKHLNNVRNYPDAHFKMGANIVFADSDFATDGAFYNDGKGWVPIEEFSGVFDGAGHSIQNLFFDIDTTRNYAGLFATNAGVIKNLSVENVDFTADATYTNLNKNVSIDVGAIVGHSSGTISNCFASGTIQAFASLGGTNASTSYTADVCGGGLVGSLSVTGTITNCYNTASVTVKSTASQPTPCAGGIAGEVLGTVSHSYNVGIVTASFAGGIAGNLSSSGEISDCYYSEKSTKGVGYGVDNCVKCTLENMIQVSTYSGFDFTNTWTFNDQNGYPYPVLQNGVVPTLQNNSTEFAGGTGLPWNPYLISTKEHLNNVRNHLDACFKMTCDIEFNDADFKSGGIFYNSGKGWKPIGDHWNSTFKGTFDGNNKKIINLQINDAINTDRDTGLFGYNSGTIKNLIISDSHIASISYPSNIGCIVGQNEYNGIVENCITINSKLTSSAGDAIGGIVGYNEGIIRDCTNQATITSSTAARVGGICGSNAGGGSLIGLIQRCNNSGRITLGAPSEQGARVGGIAGSNGSESIIEYSANTGVVSVNAESALVGGIAGELYGTIQQCYNTGSVEVTTKNTVYVGGILGLNESGTIENSYNTASVSGTRTGYSGDVYVGGIVGKHESVLDTLNCYTLGSVSGKGSSSATYVGYVCGYNATSTIENCYYLGIVDGGSGFGDYSTMHGKNVAVLKNQNTYTGFDFTDIWTIAGNSDYPFPELVATSMVYKKDVISIQIESIPTKREYVQNYESLDIAGGTLKVTYKYDEYAVIPLSDATVSGFDNSVVGKQSITVSYLGHTTELEVEIIQKSLERIEVTTLPNKTTYYMGEALSTEGLGVTAYYNDNTCETVTDYSINGATSMLGTNKITVAWHDKLCTFDITVICVPGDIDGDQAVTQDDAVYLLLHTMFGETFYPLNNAPADIDGSGAVDQDDAVYLLLHTMFGEAFYPLSTPALPAKTEE